MNTWHSHLLRNLGTNLWSSDIIQSLPFQGTELREMALPTGKWGRRLNWPKLGHPRRKGVLLRSDSPAKPHTHSGRGWGRPRRLLPACLPGLCQGCPKHWHTLDLSGTRYWQDPLTEAGKQTRTRFGLSLSTPLR